MLQIHHLKKSYNKKTEVLSDIDYTFEEGRVYPVLGGIGSGRTTLFDCLSGDLPVDAGEIATKEKTTIFHAAKQSILPMYITAYEYIHFLCDLKNVPVPADEFLDKVGMEENAKDTLICELSFEDKKRVQLAAFLVQKPYDEPFDYCSENYIRTFLQVLQTVKENHIILISTGLLEIAKQISNEILLLHNGRFEVVPSETLQVQELRRAVLDIIGEADHGNL